MTDLRQRMAVAQHRFCQDQDTPLDAARFDRARVAGVRFVGAACARSGLSKLQSFLLPAQTVQEASSCFR